MTDADQVGVRPASTSGDGGGVVVPLGRSMAKKTTISHSPAGGGPAPNVSVPPMLVVPELLIEDEVVGVRLGAAVAVPETGGPNELARGTVGVAATAALAGVAVGAAAGLPRLPPCSAARRRWR
ncbi:MAG: hypothetical protein U0841_05855 [Chloroflexia bacterium]